ncbi:MAG: GNAT family N-acetyltransferase [Bdellovibrionales bacterium]
MDESDITFVPVTEADFDDFRRLRKSVMREHHDRHELPWDEREQDQRQRMLFDQEGLRAIKYKGSRVGYVGARYDPQKDQVELGRFCIASAYQGKGIGGATMRKLFAESAWQGKTWFLEVLLKNPVARLYERLGFVRTGDDGLLAYYERRPETGNP